MAVSFTHSEIRKLMFLCDMRMNYAEEIVTSDEYSNLEKQLAQNEGEYMQHLHAKLESILEVEAKRVEIKRG